MQLIHISLLVKDYDEALAFYTQVLDFAIVEDKPSLATDGSTKRWVLIQPKNGGCNILLAKAANDEQLQRLGNQTGGRVFLFLQTNEFDKYHQKLIDNKVEIVRQPVKQEYGTVLVFRDLYGNLWDLIEV